MQIEYLIPVVSYLLGSIPFGYLLVKSKEGEDIRSFGSGNIGATNVFRKSRSAGALTLLLDAGKGYLAVAMAGWIGGSLKWQTAAAVCAIIGHVFTVWLRFRGGKGVATGCGVFLALAPLPLLATLAVFVLILLGTRYISAASIGAAAAFPVLTHLFGKPLFMVWGAALGAVIIIARHAQNIRRILSHSERKFAVKAPREKS